MTGATIMCAAIRDALIRTVPMRRRAEKIHRLHRIVDVAQRRLQPVEKVPPGVGQRDAARRAVEQADPQPFLEPADRVADGGGRHAVVGRGALETQVPGDRGEDGKVREIGLRHD